MLAIRGVPTIAQPAYGPAYAAVHRVVAVRFPQPPFSPCPLAPPPVQRLRATASLRRQPAFKVTREHRPPRPARTDDLDLCQSVAARCICLVTGARVRAQAALRVALSIPRLVIGEQVVVRRTGAISLGHS